jgi:hypothetical protein
VTAATDIRYGRRGGSFTSGNRVDVASAPRCAICQLPMLLGQRITHLICTEEAGFQHPQGNYPASTALAKGSPHHKR